MSLDFSLFSNDPFPMGKAITNRSGIESCAVDDFFRGRKRFETTLKELREDYECDESACLSFMEPEAFVFFLPLFVKLAICDYNEADNIPDSLVYKLHRVATGGADNWREEILRTYSKDQRDIVVEFLDEMSRIEWGYQNPDLAAEAARLLREKF
ncbi:DUF6714 family protein [Paraburkholderia lycopersici]|uniref:Uncharacterized protein n=1 Tax=Paraburkholderia lycopersici TaxID=416944 RepID=A0A1G6XFZ8_9BURK|nr:DUF6714 family protein [Paraburkholderia lycopersici]SDD76247.1 hypothetical protein SAMN05421548_1254 [Paraburkholderia lycopersici]